MRRLFFIMITTLALILPVTAMASSTGDDPAKAKVTALVDKYAKRDGFELTKFGTFATSTMRSMMKLAAKGQDEQSRKMMKVFDGVKNFMVFQYEDCSNSAKAAFEREFKTAVSGYDVLIEAKDGGDKVTIFALIDQKKSQVNDLILQADGSLLILNGSIDLNTIMDAAKQMK